MITNLDDSSFASFIQSEKTVLVDFTAEWCPPCKMLNPILEELADEVPDLAVGKLDVDENPETTEKFGVMSMPTLFFFRRGEVVGQFVGLRPKTQLVTMINDLR